MRLIDKIKKMGSLLILSTCCLTSCNFLDVVPPEQAGLGDAVKKPESTLGFLYSCYAGIKGSSNPITYTGMEAASTDEFVFPELWGHSGQRAGWGLLTPESPGDWKWGNIYRYIGQCYLFLSQLPNALDVSEVQKREWTAEANFLIAYYHFLILEYYGPCPITDSYIDMDTPNNEYHGRYHFDYVTSWISMKLDEAAKDLPASRIGSEWGRATSTIAKAVKARLLLYAASDLWNGKFPYPDWKNKNFETPGYGKELVSQIYDPDKWERALTASKDALEWAEGEGGCGLMTTKESAILMGNQGLNLGELDVPVDGVTEEFKKHVAVQAQIELGFERFLEEKNYQAIVTHFGDLGALKQLPGLAIQRLMEKGYGFGAEGDWKVAAMVRLMKIMTAGMKDAKGTSMLEDYTYNLMKGKEGILEAHMLEICPTIADGPISIKCQPLSMGDREDPARLVFTSKEGTGIATSLVDLGDRFRLIINTVDCKKTEKPMPKLPVATNFWTPQPDLYTGAEAWILAGGAHHTAFTYDLTAEQMGDWAAAMGIEAVFIDNDTTIRNFKKDLMLGNIFYK